MQEQLTHGSCPHQSTRSFCHHLISIWNDRWPLICISYSPFSEWSPTDSSWRHYVLHSWVVFLNLSLIPKGGGFYLILNGSWDSDIIKWGLEQRLISPGASSQCFTSAVVRLTWTHYYWRTIQSIRILFCLLLFYHIALLLSDFWQHQSQAQILKGLC